MQMGMFSFRGGKLLVTQSMGSRQDTNSAQCPSSTPPQSPCTFPLLRTDTMESAGLSGSRGLSLWGWWPSTSSK